MANIKQRRKKIRERRQQQADAKLRNRGRRYAMSADRSWSHIVLALWRALAAAFWLFVRYVKAKSTPYVIVGRVVKTKEETHSDQLNSWVDHYVTYTFKINGRTFTRTKKANNLVGIARGDRVRVHCINDSDPVVMGIDWNWDSTGRLESIWQWFRRL